MTNSKAPVVINNLIPAGSGKSSICVISFPRLWRWYAALQSYCLCSSAWNEIGVTSVLKNNFKNCPPIKYTHSIQSLPSPFDETGLNNPLWTTSVLDIFIYVYSITDVNVLFRLRYHLIMFLNVFHYMFNYDNHVNWTTVKITLNLMTFVTRKRLCLILQDFRRLGVRDRAEH